ncbi:TIGR00153 family protein [Palaeococcus ferrophilus]|uniref:TIGR00153 family protein n=1 Tax=Palaeococcus ferrophilus TaxID=83868 RepID=UPI00064E7F41|nr:TIGR00153 family protein [Palaeococcus ferrophilus]
MAIFGGKENNVFEVIEEHLKAVGKTLQKFKELVEAYVEGDEERARELMGEVEDAEREADGLRRGIEEMLYGGAFLPSSRGDYARLIEVVDNVADAAESAAHVLILARPKVPGSLREEIIKTVEAALDTYTTLKKAVSNLYRDVDLAIEYAKKTEHREEISDKVELDLMGKIFESEDVSTYAKLIWQQVVTKIGDIADRAEDASDQVLLIAIKRRG